MQHVVMFSGGIGSYCAARRVVRRHGTKNTTLLFCDTKTEDDDLYRFVDEAAAALGCPLVKLADGRDVWGVFFDRRYLGNTRIDPCSEILKRKMADRWLETHHATVKTRCYVGIDWSESHRFEALAPRKLPWIYRAPMCEAPYLSRKQMAEQVVGDGLAVPRLYALGFAHNNCGGFCVKAGQAHFANLFAKMPRRYLHHEQREQDLREHLGKDVAILRDRTGGQTRPLTLREFRRRLESGAELGPDARLEWGGCGCFGGAT